MLTEIATQRRQCLGRIEQEEVSTLHITIDRVGARKRFTRNAEIYGADEPAYCFYKVITGCVRSYKVLDDGRRLIAAFYMPGDIFGLEATERHLLSADAVSDTEVFVINRNVVTSLTGPKPALARELWNHMANEVCRAQRHLLLLNKSAAERVATFLLDMSDRIQLSDENRLPMSRDDIADHLALRNETVSRVLKAFEKASVIALRTCRHIVLRDRRALQKMIA
jgi:CRP/FNR family transcriptional regulator, nitrogen fixation regulation protein